MQVKRRKVYVISAGFFLSEEDEIAWDYATKFYEGAGFYPTTHGPLSYDAALLLCAAIEKAGTTDRQAVRDALAGITDADVQALWGDVLLAGPYEFTEDAGHYPRLLPAENCRRQVDQSQRLLQVQQV